MGFFTHQIRVVGHDLSDPGAVGRVLPDLERPPDVGGQVRRVVVDVQDRDANGRLAVLGGHPAVKCEDLGKTYSLH